MTKRERKQPQVGDYDTQEKYEFAVKRYENHLASIDVKEKEAHSVNDVLRKNLHSLVGK